MAAVSPLRGIRYAPGRVDLGAVLAPPYDVIGEAERERLHARDAHNVVRIDSGGEQPGDVAGVADGYTRAADRLAEWLAGGVLAADPRPAVYVHEHSFSSDADPGRRLVRRGLFARVPALPWEQSEVLPHERTLRGPKEDRLRLMRATRAQTSAVFVLWDRAPGLADLLAEVGGAEPDAVAEHPGEAGPEQHRLWVVDEPARLAAVTAALAPARLYIADGHHRFETAAAYARERRAAEPDAPAGADFAMVLLWMCAADDPALEVLPTHRLVLPGPGIPPSLAGLLERLGDRVTAVPATGLEAAVAAAAAHRGGDHAFAVAAADGAAVVLVPRRREGGPRRRLDVSVAEEVLLGDGCGLDPARIEAGALAYTRGVDAAAGAVARGEATLAVCLAGCTTAEIIAVSDAGETMPQKSTYFHPKVPTGLVLSPL